MTITVAMSTIEAVMLASVRIAAFLVVAPPFSHRGIPSRIKAMLSVGLALAVLPRLEVHTEGLSTGDYLGALVTQVLVGAGLGFVVQLIFSAVTAAGSMIDLSGGFQMAQAYDPGSQVNGAQFTRLFQMLTIVLLFSTGAYQVMLTGLAQSFDVVPVVGGTLDTGRLAQSLTEGLTRMFVCALQISGPLVVVLFLADAALGLVTRVAPALNAFVLGFPLKILLTLTLGVYVLLAVPEMVTSLSGQVVSAFNDVLGG